MIRKFIPAAIFLLAIFTFQSFDIPPISQVFKPKTCCGRSVCLCKHPKGSLCPFKHKAVAVSKSCHLTAKAGSGISQSSPQDAVSWTKAPCHGDAPKYAVAGSFKDGVLPESVTLLPFKTLNSIPPALFHTPVLLSDSGIERPPRIPFSPF
jgi:hypothetical protein